eukprot:m.15620 g.15620  ORF g.15620 m.15620 type:complete len:338 (-) comp8706_c0_seq1:157-1170(-)
MTAMGTNTPTAARAWGGSADRVVASLNLPSSTTQDNPPSGVGVGNGGVYHREGERFADVLLGVQLLAREGRGAEIQTLLHRLYGAVDEAPALVFGVWVLAQIDAGNSAAARHDIEAWLPKARGRFHGLSAMPDSAAAAATSATDFARVLHVYAVQLLVPADLDALAIRTLADDTVVSASEKAGLDAAVVVAIAARNRGRVAERERLQRAAAATAQRNRAPASDGPAVAGGQNAGLLEAQPVAAVAAVSGADAGDTSASASARKHAKNFLLWVSTLLRALPNACRGLDPARAGGAVAALLMALAFLRRLTSSAAGGAILSTIFTEISWAIEKALAGLV